MKKEVADKWVEALRSGKYKQGNGRLKQKDKFCCLGVLCDLSSLGAFKPNTFDPRKEAYVTCSMLEEVAFLPRDVQAWAGMKTYSGLFRFDAKESRALYQLNDQGVSFSTIADVIEENWEHL